MRSLILAMSLMGSGTYLLYLILRPVLKKYFSVNVRIIFLLISIVFFLAPLPLFKNYYYDFINLFYNFNAKKNVEFTEIKNPIQILPDNTVVMPKINKLILLIIICWLIIGVLRLLYHYQKYKELKNSLISECSPCINPYINKMVAECKNHLHIKTNITVLTSDKIDPMTIGFINPIIVINENFESHQLKYIIEHELRHIYHKDFIMNLILLVTSVIHCFNPFVYLMSIEMKKLLEYRTDASIVLNMDKKERNSYGTTIIDVATDKNKKLNIKNMPISTFAANNSSDIKERIYEMKNAKKHTKLNFILAVLILVVSIIASSMLVFAYDDYTVENISQESFIQESNNSTKDSVSDINVFMTEDYERNIEINTELHFNDEINSLFIDENNDVYPIEEDAESYALCNHTYVSGIVSKHTKFSDGSCITNYYEGQRCTKCGAIITGSFIKSTTYAVCPH